MQKVLFFGDGSTGQKNYGLFKDSYDIVAFMDNDSNKWGKNIEGVPIMSPEKCLSTIMDYDKIFITSAVDVIAITNQLLRMNIPQSKISADLVVFEIEARKTFLRDFSGLANRFSPNAACAEAGVFTGEFAKYINQYFPNRTLHLFDTFEGFDGRYIAAENNLSNAQSGELNLASEDIVMGKMKYPEKVVLPKSLSKNSKI